MGLVYAFNELLSCAVTGLFTALFIWILARIGALPVLLMVPMKEDEEEEE